MKIGEKFYHQCSYDSILGCKDSISEIYEVISSCPLVFKPSSPPIIKKYINDSLNTRGWVSNVRVDSRLNTSINLMKLDLAFVFQVGNVARVYADLLKLTLLSQRSVTSLGVLAVACSHEAKLMGANYANFERVIKELEVYSKILIYPLLVLGITN